VVTPFEFVAWDDEVYAAHPLPKPQRVRHPKKKNKTQVNCNNNCRSGIIHLDATSSAVAED
jgi:hypothetical protein